MDGKTGKRKEQSSIQVSPWFRNYMDTQRKTGESYEDFLHRVMFGGKKQ